MPFEIAPPELARLVDFAERPRVDDWSFRAALVRYAQAQPQRVSVLIELMRRAELALKPHRKTIERNGDAVWQEYAGATPADHRDVVALLLAIAELDQLGDIVAQWAVDRASPRPDDAVDAVTASVAARYEQLGVAREERIRPPRQRGV